MAGMWGRAGRRARRVWIAPVVALAFGIPAALPASAQTSSPTGTAGPTGGGAAYQQKTPGTGEENAPANGPPPTVAEQIARDFQPMGFQFGDLNVKPSATIELLFDDNVYLDKNPKADFAVIEKPSIVLSRVVQDFALGLSASAALAQYIDTNNSYNDFNVEGNAGYQFTDELSGVLTLRRALLHLDRSSLSTPGTNFGPLEFNLTTASITPTWSADPFIDVAKFEWRYYDFLANGGISNRDMSNNQYYFGNRFGYQVNSLWTAFIEPSVEIHRFIITPDRNGIDHDGQIFGILGGFSYNLPNNMYVELGVGYFYDLFNSSKTGNFGGVSATGSLTWNIDPLVSLSGTVGRSVSDVVVAGGFLSPSLVGAVEQETTAASARLDWRARQNILLYVGGAIAHDDYPHATLTDNTLTVVVGSKYYFNNYLNAGLQFLHTTRFANDSAFSFDDNQIMLTLTGQM